jgi:hypothetical protein
MGRRTAMVLAGALGAGIVPGVARAAPPTWSGPLVFASSAGTYSFSDPAVALDPSGNAVVAWVTGPQNASIVKTVARAAGSESWSAAADLAVGDGLAPRVEFDEAGRVFATFTRGAWPRQYVQFSSRSAVSQPWADPITLSDPADDGVGAELAFDPAGDVLVAWTAWSFADHASGYFLQTTFRPAGGSWEHPRDLTARGTNSPRGVSIALDRAGNAIAVWARAGPVADNPVVVAAYRPVSSGVWETPVALSATLLDVRGMRVHFDQAGNAIAAWIALRGGSEEQVEASYLPMGGAWQQPTDISHVAALIDGLDLQVAAGGEAVAVWNETSVGDAGVIHSATRRAGSSRWQAPVALDEPVHGYFPQTVALGMDPKGDAVALWSGWSATAVRAAIRPADGHWQPAEDAAQVQAPDVAVSMDSAGDGLAVWEAASGSLIGGAELEGQGPIIDRVLIPKQARVGIASRFSVVALPWGSTTLAGKPSWNFGDGRSAAGTSVRHVFRSAGMYRVSVTAKDSNGKTGTASGTINVAKKKKRR